MVGAWEGETYDSYFKPWPEKFNFHIFLLFYYFFLLFYYIQNLGIDGGGIDEPPLQLDEKLHKNGRGSLKNGGQKSVEDSEIWKFWRKGVEKKKKGDHHWRNSLEA